MATQLRSIGRFVMRMMLAHRSSMVIHPADFDPAEFLGMGWSFDAQDADPRSLALTEVDFTKVLLKTCLQSGETSLTNEEKLARLKAMGVIRLDPRFGVALWREEEQKTLKSLYEERGVTYLDFRGRFLRNPSGCRCGFYLIRDTDEWCWGMFPVNWELYGTLPSALLRG